MRKGVLEESAAARLLLAAATLDLILVYVGTRAVTPVLQREITLFRMNYAEVAVFGTLLLLLWFVCELLLAGYSPGRLAVGIEMANRQGSRPAFARRTVRLLAKLSSLGLTGLRADRQAGYDRASGIVWLSAMSRKSALPVEQWRIRFLSGPHKGHSVTLAKIPNFASKKDILIGRDPNWANLTLTAPGVSSRHCILRIENQQALLKDGSGTGQASTNGTFVNRHRIYDRSWTRLDAGTPFSVGEVSMVIQN